MDQESINNLNLIISKFNELITKVDRFDLVLQGDSYSKPPTEGMIRDMSTIKEQFTAIKTDYESRMKSKEDLDRQIKEQQEKLNKPLESKIDKQIKLLDNKINNLGDTLVNRFEVNEKELDRQNKVTSVLLDILCDVSEINFDDPDYLDKLKDKYRKQLILNFIIIIFSVIGLTGAVELIRYFN